MSFFAFDVNIYSYILDGREFSMTNNENFLNEYHVHEVEISGITNDESSSEYFDPEFQESINEISENYKEQNGRNESYHFNQDSSNFNTLTSVEYQKYFPNNYNEISHPQIKDTLANIHLYHPE